MYVKKKKDCWSTKHTKEEYNKVKEGFKKHVHQYFIDNNFNNFNKDIILTTTSSNFFYNNYSIKYFIILNKPIPIETAKNIVIFINNNAFIHSLTVSTEPGSTEPSIVKSNNKGKNTTYFCNNNNNNNINIENLTVNINFLNCYFNNNK